MSDHHVMESEGPWPAGWAWSLAAGFVAAILARWLGDVSIAAAVLIALMVFGVFGVLLAQFWEAPVEADHGDGHGHDHAAPDDHAMHSHAPLAATPVAATPVGEMRVAAMPVSALKAADPVAAPPIVAPMPTAEPVATVAPVETQPAASGVDAPPTAVVTPVTSEPAASDSAKPIALTGPRNGKADALQEIEGIGPALEKLCHELGIYHFDQIAAWGVAEIAWMDANLKGFKGRVTRDKWAAQAKIIGAEGLEAFRLRAKTNDY